MTFSYPKVLVYCIYNTPICGMKEYQVIMSISCFHTVFEYSPDSGGMHKVFFGGLSSIIARRDDGQENKFELVKHL